MPKDKEKRGHGIYVDLGNVRFGSTNPKDSPYAVDKPYTYKEKRERVGLSKLKSGGQTHHSALDGKFIDDRRKL